MEILEKREGIMERARTWIKAIRVYQWVKNLLIFVPVFTALQVNKLDHLLTAGLAFFAFSFCSSAVYLVNDILDREKDRLHPTKKFRPISRGQISLQAAGLAAVLFFVAGLSIAGVFVNTGLMFLLTGYACVSTFYSLYWKSTPPFDVICLSLLYSSRILAGHLATHVPMSFWLLAFSQFIFLSLALLKRYSELNNVRLGEQDENASGRGYMLNDLPFVGSLGMASGFIAVLVFCLYINSDQVTKLYHRPYILWAAAPVLLYWISRIWFLASRGKVHEEPVSFAIRDRVSLISGAVLATIMLLASSGS